MNSNSKSLMDYSIQPLITLLVIMNLEYTITQNIQTEPHIYYIENTNA